ncbi:MAG: NmrA family NAD(P)-binding protein [Archangium sp.]|nr:NmrA family NAD(P)-binding protein [Archangium sp.]
MFVITGVTGRTGAIVADTLLSQGKQVRVVVRDAAKGEAWKKKGAEVAVADLGDQKALTAALSGAQGVYLLSPPNFAVKDFVGDRKALAETVAASVKAAKVPSVVFLSSVGAQVPAGTGPIVTVHNAEAILAKAAPSVTFVRAAYFVENWGSVLGLAKSQGILPHYGPIDVKFSQVTTADIGAASAKALLSPADGVRIIELAGKEDWSVNDVAAEVSKLIGKPVQAVSAPVEQAHAGLLQAGLPDPMAGLYAEMYAGFAKGQIGWEKPGSLTRGTTSLADGLRSLI